MKYVFSLFLLLTSCSSVNKNSGEMTFVVMNCKGTDYFYTVSALSGNSLTLVLDKRYHKSGQVVFEKADCFKKILNQKPVERSPSSKRYIDLDLDFFDWIKKTSK